MMKASGFMRALCLCGAMTAAAGIVDARDLNVGKYDSAEYHAIQDALDAAVDGDVIWVADGTYTGERNHNLNFGGKAVTLASEPGEPDDCRIDCEGLGRGFLFASGETSSAVVDGFCIVNGSADHGGGIMVDGASPTIRNCDIEGCASGYAGGGIYCSGGSPRFEGCDITGNHSGGMEGGGASMEYGSAAEFSNCTFFGNWTQSLNYGGGGLASRGSSPWVRGCVFEGNASGQGGGVMVLDDGSPVIQDCVFTENYALDNGFSGYGGGICLYWCTGSPRVERCTLSGNVAEFEGGAVSGYCAVQGFITDCVVTGNTSMLGGGISCSGGSSSIAGCRIEGNTAYGWGGGISSDAASVTAISRCIVMGNRAVGAPDVSYVDGPEYLWENGSGGGIACRRDTTTLRDSVIAGNDADSAGGGIYIYYSEIDGEAPPVIRNCTIRDNGAGGPGGGVYCWKIDSAADDHLVASGCIVWGNDIFGAANEGGPVLGLDYCDIEGGIGAVGLTDSATAESAHILDAEPLFTDDYHIGSSSPCINAGDPRKAVTIANYWKTDIDGQPRVAGKIIDIGADEVR
jgi:hypothetical protein